MAAAAVWPILLNTAQGVRAVDPGHLLVARSLGATRIETLRTVILPSIRDSVLTGIRRLIHCVRSCHACPIC